MAPAQLLQQQALRAALQLVSKRSSNAALRQRLTDFGVTKSSRLFHTSVKRFGGDHHDHSNDPWYEIPPSAQLPERMPPFREGVEPTRMGGPPGGDELARQGLGPEADDWRNWSPEKMETETNYLMKLNKSDLLSQEHWVSFGCDVHDRIKDIALHRFITFMCVIQAAIVIFAAYYWPFLKYKDWGQREAYLEIARREALGLPLVDPDYIPPEKMLLPSDEELEALGVEPMI